MQMQISSRPSFRLLRTMCFTFHLPGHKSVQAPAGSGQNLFTREGASTAASPSEPSYLPFLPCDRDPQLLHGRPHPSLSKHGTHPKCCAVVAAYYLGSLPRPQQRDTICICVWICVCKHQIFYVEFWSKEERIEFKRTESNFQSAHWLIRSEWLLLTVISRWPERSRGILVQRSLIMVPNLDDLSSDSGICSLLWQFLDMGGTRSGLFKVSNEDKPLQASNTAGVRLVLRAHLENSCHLGLEPGSSCKILVQLLQNGKV